MTDSFAFQRIFGDVICGVFKRCNGLLVDQSWKRILVKNSFMGYLVHYSIYCWHNAERGRGEGHFYERSIYVNEKVCTQCDFQAPYHTSPFQYMIVQPVSSQFWENIHVQRSYVYAHILRKKNDISFCCKAIVFFPKSCACRKFLKLWTGARTGCKN